MEPPATRPADVVPIFSHGEQHRYRVHREGDAECPCAALRRLGCPVDQYVPANGDLTLEFYAACHEEGQAVVEELRAQYSEMTVRRIEQSPAANRSRDEVHVNRGELTERQLEVLRTANEMGYFATPRESNATEVAAELEISLSTLREHLSTAQQKVLSELL